MTASETIETQLIHTLADFSGARVLDVGAGDGRFAAYFAQEVEQAALLDPNADELAAARRELGDEGIGKLAFHAGHAERLPYAAASFDLAVFSWSL